MAFKKLKDLHKQTFIVEGIKNNGYKRWNPSTNSFETSETKQEGFSAKFLLNIGNDDVVEVGYMFLKDLKTQAGANTDEDIIGKTYMLIWNQATGKEARYMTTIQD